MITVAALSPALDMTYVVDELVLGEPHRPTSVVRVAGGKALNSARAAARLGADVVAVPVLGGRVGALVEVLLRDAGAVRGIGAAADAGGGVGAGVAAGAAAGVGASADVGRGRLETRLVDGRADTRMCVSIASETAGSLTEIYEHPVPLGSEVWADVVDTLRSTIRPGSWLSVSGGLPDSAATGLVDVVRLAQSAGARLALDTHGTALRSVLDLGSGALTLLKVNRAEAAEALDTDASVDLAVLVAGLRERAGCDVVVTDGASGSLAADAAGLWRVVLPSSAGAFGAHPVGSGDSYLGGLLAALDSGASLPEAAALGAGAATANALVPGAAVFDPARARSLAATVTVTPVSRAALAARTQ